MSTKTSFWNAKTLSWFAIIFGLGLFISFTIVVRPQTPTQYPKYVVESPSPSGLKAFYTLLKHNFGQVEVWKKPAQALTSPVSGQLMLLVQPSAPLTDNELQNLTQWMEAGNRLWLLQHDPQSVFDLHTIQAGNSGQTTTLTGLEEWQGSYQAALETAVRLEPDPKDHVLLKDEHGVVALSRTYGTGELMVLLAPEWLTNSMILQHDHLQLLRPFIVRATPKVIWLNDFIHGYNNLPSVLGVYPEWFLVIFAQFGLSLLLWLWYKGKRFGSIQTPREWVVRFGDERIRAVAAWYERGRFYQESLAIQAEYLRQAAQARWGIPIKLDEQEFIQVASQHLPPDKQKLWLQNWQELKHAYSHKISQQTYLKGSKLLAEMQKEVEQH